MATTYTPWQTQHCAAENIVSQHDLQRTVGATIEAIDKRLVALKALSQGLRQLRSRLPNELLDSIRNELALLRVARDLIESEIRFLE